MILFSMSLEYETFIDLDNDNIGIVEEQLVEDNIAGNDMAIQSKNEQFVQCFITFYHIFLYLKIKYISTTKLGVVLMVPVNHEIIYLLMIFF